MQPLSSIAEPGEEPVIAIDAAYYLEQYRFPAKEPLVTALGGSPMNLEAVITKDIHEIESFGCKTFFFFDGLDCGPDEGHFGPSVDAMSVNTKAFAVYEQGDAVGAINDFKQSGISSLCSNPNRHYLTATRLPGYAGSLLLSERCAAQARLPFRCCPLSRSRSGMGLLAYQVEKPD